MENRNKALFKNTVILAIGQFVPKLLAIITLPILTGRLVQEDYGLYELSLSVASFCIPLLSVQIQQAAFRFLIDPNEKREDVISNSFIFAICMFLIASIPIIFGWYLFSHNIIYGILFYFCYLFEMLLSWAGQVTRGTGDGVRYSIAYIIYSIAFLTCILLSYFAKRNLSIYDVSISIIASYLLAFSFLVIKKRLYSSISFKFFRKTYLLKMLQYSGPMVISSVALWVVNLSDRFFISGVLGLEMTAIYGVANKIPNLFNSVYNVFNLAWTENTSRLTQREKDKGYYTTFFSEFYNVMVGMMGILICMSPLLFKVLVRNYSEAYGLMAWLYVGVFFSSLVSFFGSIYVGEKRTKDVGISSAVGAAINVFVNFIFMKRFGLIIAAISTIISYLIICVYRAVDIKKYVVIEYNYGKIALGLVTIILLASINYKFSVPATIITLCVTIGYNIIFNRQFFLNLFRMLKRRITKGSNKHE